MSTDAHGTDAHAASTPHTVRTMLAVSEDEATSGKRQLVLEAYGVRAVVEASSEELLDHVKTVLPPGWTPGVAGEGDRLFGIKVDGGPFCLVEVDGRPLARDVELDVALGVLDASLRSHIAVTAPDSIFVHAGVVAHRGRALVIPGPSFSGKTTLVAALVAAGAEYYSDEYAVFDPAGLVHPYAKPLSIRAGDSPATDHDVTSLGGRAGEGPLPLGLVAMTLYRPGAQWQPRRLSGGEGILSLVSNAVAAENRPGEVLGALTRAARGVPMLEGERGEAAALAPRLLELLST